MLSGTRLQNSLIRTGQLGQNQTNTIQGQNTTIGELVRELKNIKIQRDEIDKRVMSLEEEIPIKIEATAITYMSTITQEALLQVLPAIVVLASSGQVFSLKDVSEGLVKSDAQYQNSKLHSILQRVGLQRNDLNNAQILARKIPQYQALYQYIYFIISDDNSEQMSVLDDCQDKLGVLGNNFNASRQQLIDYHNQQIEVIAEFIQSQKINAQKFIQTAALRVRKFEECQQNLLQIGKDAETLQNIVGQQLSVIQSRTNADYLVCVENINKMICDELVDTQFMVSPLTSLNIQEVEDYLQNIRKARDILLLTIGINFGFQNDQETQLSIQQKMEEYQNTVSGSLDNLNLFLNELCGIFRSSEYLLGESPQQLQPQLYQQALAEVKKLSVEITVEQNALFEKISILKSFQQNAKLVFKLGKDVYFALRKTIFAKQEIKNSQTQIAELEKQANDANEIERDMYEELLINANQQCQQKIMEKDQNEVEQETSKQQLTDLLGTAQKLTNEEIFEIMFVGNYQEKIDLKQVIQIFKVVAMHISYINQ